MNLTDLDQYAQANDPKLISRVKYFLDRTDIQDTKGAQRVAVVCENFKFLTFEQAYHLIDPDTFQEEFEETQSYKLLIKLLNYGRIILSLAPLILTWFALFAAANGYQNDLIRYPDDRTEAFLQLWQDGFHHTTSFTFSLTALIDVILLLLLLTSSVFILGLEYRAQQTAKRFAEDLRNVTEGLLNAVNTAGVSPVTSQADIDKIVRAVRVALGGVFTTTENVIRQALDVVLKANDRVEQLFTNQVQPLFTKFEQNVSTFHLDVNKLTQEVSDIATASTTLATSSTSMVGSAADMATSATNMQASVQKIDQHIIDLNKTEKEMVVKIEASQQRVAAEMNRAASSMDTAATKVTGSANKMDQAAQKVENVGQMLSTINPQNVKQMNNDATIFAVKARETAQELQTTIDALKKLSGQSGPRRTRSLFNLFSPNRP
jgi:methyl-accepting chemotaxis protein